MLLKVVKSIFGVLRRNGQELAGYSYDSQNPEGPVDEHHHEDGDDRAADDSRLEERLTTDRKSVV